MLQAFCTTFSQPHMSRPISFRVAGVDLSGCGAFIGAWLVHSHPCQCICSGTASSEVLAILETQLSRCGPEQLSPTPVIAAQVPQSTQLGLYLAVYLVGVLSGCLLVLFFGGGAHIGRSLPPAAAVVAPVVPSAPPAHNTPLEAKAAGPAFPGPQWGPRLGLLTPSAKKALALQNGGD